MDIDEEIRWMLDAEPTLENIERVELARQAIENRIAAVKSYIARGRIIQIDLTNAPGLAEIIRTMLRG